MNRRQTLAARRKQAEQQRKRYEDDPDYRLKRMNKSYWDRGYQLLLFPPTDYKPMAKSQPDSE